MIVTGWIFVCLSWLSAPMGSGGWYATTLGPFATEAACKAAAEWTVKTAAPKPMIASPCYPATGSARERVN